MTFARWVFTLGGIWGILVLAPLYFLEGMTAARWGPVTYPENYYGFVGAALAWQFVYLLIGRDPARYRPLMLVGIFAKLSFGLATWILHGLGRTPLEVAVISSPDLVLAALFAVIWLKTKPA